MPKETRAKRENNTLKRNKMAKKWRKEKSREEGEGGRGGKPNKPQNAFCCWATYWPD